MIFASRSSEAEKFQDWVTDEVLPQIRRTGGYIQVSENERLIRIIYHQVKVEDKLNNKSLSLEIKIMQKKDCYNYTVNPFLIKQNLSHG